MLKSAIAPYAMALAPKSKTHTTTNRGIIPTCSQWTCKLNPMETKWDELKMHELNGQMFEDELDLAYVVIDGVEPESREKDIWLRSIDPFLSQKPHQVLHSSGLFPSPN